MNILGLETSCDETAASMVKNGVEILSNIVSSSVEIHAKTGGIIPEQAARQQIRSIIPVIDTALKEAKLDYCDIDALAVTVGPGLIGSLLVGVETAKTLSYLWQKPLIPANHLVAHIYANWLNNLSFKSTSTPPQFPALALVVSGGHTDLVLLKGSNHLKIQWVGGTRDDAAGEAFDKTARLLNLPYPGGPSIAAEALKVQKPKTKLQFNLPRPMLNEDNFDFSFSGLKTAVLYTVQELQSKQRLNDKAKQELAFELQEAIVDVLAEKTLKAVKKYKPKSLLLAGGVASNKRLTENFLEKIKENKLKINFLVPPPKLCTDNAAYVAAYAFFNYSPIPWQNISANPQLSILD